MEIILVPVAIAVILAPPFISAMMARSLGRSYWKWFFIGCILPFISSLILVLLPEQEKVSRQKFLKKHQ